MSGFTAADAVRRGEEMEIAEPMTAPRTRLLIRAKGFLGGWRVVSDGVGDKAHLLGTIDLVRAMIREDGDDPAGFEFRIDSAPPVEWVAGEVVDGADKPKEDHAP